MKKIFLIIALFILSLSAQGQTTKIYINGTAYDLANPAGSVDTTKIATRKYVNNRADRIRNSYY